MDIDGWCKNDHKNVSIHVYERQIPLIFSLLVNILVCTRVARCHTRILLVIPLKFSDIAVHILRILSFYTNRMYHGKR